MSFESYRKAIEEQRDREKQYAEEYQFTSNRDSTKTVESNYKIRNEKRSGCSKLFFLFLVLLFVAAIIKNPTEAEAQKQIKETAIERIQYYMKDNEDADQSSFSFGEFVTTLMLPTIYDNFTKTEVTDHFLFSSFSVSTKGLDENYKVSGVIVFGKIIIWDKEEI